ncbi:MAG TPA: penicillin-binding protein activator [Gammaproteobacteria bacterium]|nr:penicillin-binding protein activator [Gammaproteobacteria bacterium]
MYRAVTTKLRIRSAIHWQLDPVTGARERNGFRCVGQQRRAGRALTNAVLAAGLVLLAACSTAPPAQRPVRPSSLAGQARADEQKGQLGAAEALYRQLAAQTSGSVSAGYLLEAARLEIQLNDLAGAATRLDAASKNADAQQTELIAVLRADIDTHSGQAAAALARLAQLPKQLPPKVLAEADRVRGAAFFASNRPVDAVRALVERGTWLDTGPEILANQRLIWDGLAASPSAQSAAATGDPVVDGWLALAPIAASKAQGTELRRALLEWRRRYANHPAAGGLLASLLESQRNELGFPAQVALLLPLSSPPPRGSATRTSTPTQQPTRSATCF